MTSNRKELLAIERALDVFRPRLETQSCRHILIQSDNTTAVYNINRKAAAPSLYLYLRRLLDKAEKMNLTLTAVHIPGVENTTTDSLSCLELSGDYQIKKPVILEVLKKLQFRPNVDLFARKSNAILRNFCSLKLAKEKEKERVARMRNGKPEMSRLGNAFQIKWSKMNPIIHPPIPLIMKSLRKFEEEVKLAALIVPDWKGQPWSSLLRKLSIAKVKLGPSEKVLIKGNLMMKNYHQAICAYI
jgi:hypothetical protein